MVFKIIFAQLNY